MFNENEVNEDLNFINGLNLDNLNGGMVETADTLLGNTPFKPSTQQPTSTQPNQQLNQQPNQQLNETTIASVNTQPIQQPTINWNTVNQAMSNNSLNENLDRTPNFARTDTNFNTTESNFLKLKTGESTLIAILSAQAIPYRTHYESGLGYFKCLSEFQNIEDYYPINRCICCMQPNPNPEAKDPYLKSTLKYLIPVVEYPVSHNDIKTFIQGNPVLKIFSITRENYQYITEFCTENDVKNFDIKVSKTKSGQWTKCNLIFTPTIRSKFNGLVESEFAKINNRTYNLAEKECAKTISIEKLTQYYDAKNRQELLANQIANQQVPGVSTTFAQN